ncbi:MULTISPECIES: nuclear transport factor 2 family protein [Pseudoalteromonas]|uniref:SnoaL-like domain-containing protein n=1 Tax=Pseudoalteromonas amylolytica TaxID=1859457 RepID=A0A1S1MU45_9GAMM|nr:MULTISPECIES: nuclear transport factor 2 family protein [Pseudoalteromonas]MCF6436723.1 nuclear transport factor 2 family protein [Pseudoalteromonas sp. MMG022]OHU90233.1 hypothetical protein BFC16_04610 [Pseudoalteromonas sp. JW3]OHU92400.1 hypothetical protein BET10_05610 [Pseudoalteromonas amylolytica]
MENKIIIENMFLIIDSGEFDRLVEVFHPDVVYQRPGYSNIEGLEDLENFYKNVRVVRRGLHTINDLVCEGEKLVCIGAFEGENSKGQSLETRFSDVYQLKDGKISHRETYFFKPYI